MGITCGLQVWAHRVAKGPRGFSATEIDNDYMSLLYAGWGTWIRTKTSGVRVRCSTLKLFPSRMPKHPLAGRLACKVEPPSK